MTALEILKAARKRHSDPSMWLKGSSGYFVNFGPCCMAGMIKRVGDPDNETTDGENLAYGTVSEIIGGSLISHWNDEPSRTHEDILNAYDAAITKLENVNAHEIQ